jgi:putative endonuclease
MAEGHRFNPDQRLQSLKWYLYVLRSIPTGKHYIGISADVAKRLGEHNTRSGRWTSAFKPWEVLHTEEHPDRSAAARRERFLKSLAGIEAREELTRNGEGKI